MTDMYCNVTDISLYRAQNSQHLGNFRTPIPVFILLVKKDGPFETDFRVSLLGTILESVENSAKFEHCSMGVSEYNIG